VHAIVNLLPSGEEKTTYDERARLPSWRAGHSWVERASHESRRSPTPPPVSSALDDTETGFELVGAVAELYNINVLGHYIKFKGYFKQPLIYCAANYTVKTKYITNID
jgi:hypothetical protein